MCAQPNAQLCHLPPGTEPRLVALLASLLLPPETGLSGLDSSFADLPQLAAKLSAEGFDGALRFTREAQLGFALFSKGRRVLDVFGPGWPAQSPGPRWEAWIAGSGALASVEAKQARFPSVTFRQQLRDLVLEVVRPSPDTGSPLLSDTLADANALRLVPRQGARGQLRRGDSTLQSLVDGAPAYALARWMLVGLAPQFEQYDRTSKWKALVEPLARVSEVRLHHGCGADTLFDVTTWAEDGRLLHVARRASVGDKATVERFFAHVIALKQERRPEELGGVALVAPSFTDDGLAAWLQGLRTHSRSLFKGLDALGHKEGFLRLGARSGLHVLLVEDNGGRLRPLMPS